MDSLIKQHHGSRNGLGIEMNTFNLAPAGLIYMIASEFAISLIRSQEESDYQLDRKSFLKTLEKKYGKNPKFKNYIHYFEQLKI